jgi:hypothetical protein
MNAFLISPFTAASYSPPVTTFLGSVDTAGMRNAMGLGTTDSPTFASLTVTTSAGANVFSTGAAAVQNAGFLGASRAINLIDTAGISWSSTSALLGATGTNLFQDAAGILAQRNGTNAQMFRVYNTYTDASNYERMHIGYQPGAAAFQILSDALGAGSSPRQLQIGTNTAASLVFTTANAAKWQVTSAGHFLAVTHNAYDIGAAGGVSCPRNIFAANTIDAPFITSQTSLSITAAAGGAGISIGCSRFRINGNTSSFPAFKNVGTRLDFILADDTGFTGIQSLYQRFGSGSPESVVTAPTGATYHRTDGGSGSSYYVKESGTGNTGWVGK